MIGLQRASSSWLRLTARRLRQLCRLEFFTGVLITLAIITFDLYGSPIYIHTGTYSDSVREIAAKDASSLQLTNLARDKRTASLRHQLRYNQSEHLSESHVSCSALFEGQRDALSQAEAIQRHMVVNTNDSLLINVSDNCERFRRERGYATRPLCDEEESFPLAYSIVLFQNVPQVELLLHAIYQPQNFYCLHVDSSASEDVKAATSSIASCFPNVFVAANSVNVQWGHYTVVEAELVCMESLLERSKSWKYFINLTGQEFPLKTNWELVQILKAVNGSNLISGTREGRNNRRTKWTFVGNMFVNRLKPPTPGNMTLTKGPVHILATRDYVSYVINDPLAKRFWEWAKLTAVPDETFFTTLNHNPHLNVPGAYKGHPEISDRVPHVARLKVWGRLDTCYGSRRRGICIFGLGDLPKMAHTVKLFANKFYMERDPLVLRCLDELLRNRTALEVRGQRSVNVTFYETLDVTRNHVPSSLNKKEDYPHQR